MMAAVTLQPPASQPRFSSAEPASLASPANIVQNSTEHDFKTIDGLLRARSNGHFANEAIVAYPSSGTDYEYYTPRQVSFACNKAQQSNFVLQYY
jgi:hypothetical protein